MSVPETTAIDLRMLSPVELAAGLRGMAAHRDAGNVSVMEAALLRAAATYIAGATGSLREHMGLLKASREETAAVRKMSIAMEDLARKLGFYEGRARAVAVCLRKAQASEEDDLTPILSKQPSPAPCPPPPPRGSVRRGSRSPCRGRT